jgi:hypothetical protein
MITGNSIFQRDVTEHFALFFVRSAHIVLDVQCSIQLPNGRFFPQPVKPNSFCVLYGTAEQAAEKLGFGVILSEAKNLSST